MSRPEPPPEPRPNPARCWCGDNHHHPDEHPVRRPRRPLRIPSWLGALLEFLLLVWIGVEILVGDLERALLAAVLILIGRTRGPGKGSPPDDPESPR